MERLTRRSANGTGVYATPSGEPVKWENNRNNVLQKLADYEDLEEQGRLIKLPCKVGDDVYYILGIPNETRCAIDKCTFEFPDIIEIGKTLFLTQAEAEQKLKEMESD